MSGNDRPLPPADAGGGPDPSASLRVEIDEQLGGRPPLEKGFTVGRYVLEEKIARGGMAEIWRARLEGAGEFDRRFAIKFMLDTITADSDYLRMFMREAAIARDIAEHANVLVVNDFARVPLDANPSMAGRYYIVMEWVKGADLDRFMRALRGNGQKVRQSHALFITAEILKGLDYIHNARDRQSTRLNLVHRDISPHNVLLSYTGGVKISDFGVARSANGVTAKRAEGKYSYFAPETVRHSIQTQQSDQFAVGVVLWEMLAGRKLFAGESDAEILRKVGNYEIPELDREVHPDVTKVLETMLNPDPARRYPSADEALSAIYKIPNYTADGRELGKMLLYLFPDPELRLPTPERPQTLGQLSGPIQDELGYPVPMEPSVTVAIDWHTREMIPFWPGFIARKPWLDVTVGEWLHWWKRRGLKRDDEIAREPTRSDSGRR